MDRTVYVKIVQEVMLPYGREEMSLFCFFQQDNDPKLAHTSKLAQQWCHILQPVIAVLIRF